jgi:hypothetical protein
MYLAYDTVSERALGFTLPATLSMFFGTIRKCTGFDDKCLERQGRIEFSDRVHGPDRFTSDEENGKLCRVCKAEKEWCNNVRIG